MFIFIRILLILSTLLTLALIFINIIIRDIVLTLSTLLRNYSYLQNRDLLLDLITLLALIIREFYKSRNYKEIISNKNLDNKD